MTMQITFECQKLEIKAHSAISCLVGSGRHGESFPWKSKEGNVGKKCEGERLKIKNTLQLVPNESHCKLVVQC